MSASSLESLVVIVPGEIKSSPAEQAKETLRIAVEVAAEITRTTMKCLSLTHLEGRPAAIIGLKMTGKATVEDIEVTYLSEGKKYAQRYSKGRFYDL